MEGAATVDSCLIRILSWEVSGSTIPTFVAFYIPKTSQEAILTAFGRNATYCERRYWPRHCNKLFIDTL